MQLKNMMANSSASWKARATKYNGGYGKVGGRSF
jgi:hypothetical protein